MDAINNNQVNNDPSFEDFKGFTENLEEGVQVQIGDNRHLIVADRTASQLSRALKTRSSAEARAANNEVRTALLKAVLVKCNVDSFAALPPSVRAQFSGTKEHYTGLGSDMALEGEGVHAHATSGRPLSVRRITAIVNATTEYAKKLRKADLAIMTLEGVLRQQDQEYVSSPTLAFANDIAIKNLVAGLLDKFFGVRGFSRQQSQVGQAEVSAWLTEFFRDLEPLLPGNDANEKAGLMLRFKDEVFNVLKDANMSDGMRVCTDEEVEQLQTQFKEIGNQWTPDNVTPFENLGGDDDAVVEFLKGCKPEQARAINKFLKALEKVDGEVFVFENDCFKFAKVADRRTELIKEFGKPEKRIGSRTKESPMTWWSAFKCGENPPIGSDFSQEFVMKLLNEHLVRQSKQKIKDFPFVKNHISNEKDIDNLENEIAFPICWVLDAIEKAKGTVDREMDANAAIESIVSKLPTAIKRLRTKAQFADLTPDHVWTALGMEGNAPKFEDGSVAFGKAMLKGEDKSLKAKQAENKAQV